MSTEDPTAEEVEDFRRRHWMHWNSEDNLLISHLVQKMRMTEVKVKDCGEAGHEEGRCGNASCFKNSSEEKKDEPHVS